MTKMEELALIATPCIGETEAARLAGQPEIIGFPLPKCKYIRALKWITTLSLTKI
jgi:hypothetical protein